MKRKQNKTCYNAIITFTMLELKYIWSKTCDIPSLQPPAKQWLAFNLVPNTETLENYHKLLGH